MHHGTEQRLGGTEGLLAQWPLTRANVIRVFTSHQTIYTLVFSKLPCYIYITPPPRREELSLTTLVVDGTCLTYFFHFLRAAYLVILRWRRNSWGGVVLSIVHFSHELGALDVLPIVLFWSTRVLAGEETELHDFAGRSRSLRWTDSLPIQNFVGWFF